MNRLIDEYFVAMDDQKLVDSVVSIFVEMKAGTRPANEQLSVCYTVADVLAIDGYYASELIIDDVVDNVIDATVKQLAFALYNKAPDCSMLYEVLKKTNDQRDRCVPQILNALLSKYGTPRTINYVAIYELCDRATKMYLSGFFSDELSHSGIIH